MANHIAVVADKKLFLWNVDYPDVLQVIKPSTSSCLQVSFNSNASVIGWNSDDHPLQFYSNPQSPTQIPKQPTRSVSPPPPLTSPPSSTKALKIIPGFSKEVLRVLYFPNAGGIVALSGDGSIKIWKWANNKSATPFEAPNHITCKNGKNLTNYVSDPSSQRSSVLIYPTLITTSNSLFILSSYGNKIALWNVEKMEELLKIYGPDSEPSGIPTCISLSLADNNNLAIGLDDKSIRIYSVMLKSQQCKLIGHQAVVTSIYFDSQLLISGSTDG